MRLKARWVFALACLTVVLHIAQISWYYAPPSEYASQRGTSSRPGNAPQHERPAVAPLELLVVTATQPAPCTTLHGDHMVQLALKNKWQYASRHGYGTWASTELLSPWDLGGQWNKVALLSVLSEEGCTAVRGARWLLWVDDDAIFVDMNFTMPLQRYEAAGIDLVLWGDDGMTYEQGDSEGVNTGTMLLRISDWGRALLRAWAALASSPLRDSLRNHDQGGLVHLLHSQPELWRAKTRLERDFTMNGHWPEFAGRFVRGRRTLKSAVWGHDAAPFLLHFSGCQMCRGHSYNGTWTEAGIDRCRASFLEAFTFADDQILETIGLRHPRLGQMTARANPGSLLQRRHARLTRCMPSFLVVGTQKGGTSSLHYLLKNGWHDGIHINEGEKEIHYFSLDDTYAKGAAVYQQRWDGESGVLGECPGAADRLRGEVSASYLDYPKAAERAVALLPAVRVVALLREPVARISSSFNMRWQIEICGKLTWTRRDCYLGITSRAHVRDNAVGPWQKAQALKVRTRPTLTSTLALALAPTLTLTTHPSPLTTHHSPFTIHHSPFTLTLTLTLILTLALNPIKVWTRCGHGDGKPIDLECLQADYVAKMRNRTRLEMSEIDACRRRMPSEALGSCLGLGTLGQRKLYKKMEDAAFVYRSIYHDHLQHWLKFLPPAQLLVLPSEALFDQQTIQPAMARLARFLSLPAEGAAVHSELLFRASTASTSSAPHENGREYISDAPRDVAAALTTFLCAKNRMLAELLSRHKLTADGEIAWLPQALAGCTKESGAVT